MQKLEITPALEQETAAERSASRGQNKLQRFGKVILPAAVAALVAACSPGDSEAGHERSTSAATSTATSQEAGNPAAEQAERAERATEAREIIQQEGLEFAVSAVEAIPDNRQMVSGGGGEGTGSTYEFRNIDPENSYANDLSDGKTRTSLWLTINFAERKMIFDGSQESNGNTQEAVVNHARTEITFAEGNPAMTQPGPVTAETLSLALTEVDPEDVTAYYANFDGPDLLIDAKFPEDENGFTLQEPNSESGKQIPADSEKANATIQKLTENGAKSLVDAHDSIIAAAPKR